MPAEKLKKWFIVFCGSTCHLFYVSLFVYRPRGFHDTDFEINMMKEIIRTRNSTVSVSIIWISILERNYLQDVILIGTNFYILSQIKVGVVSQTSQLFVFLHAKEMSLQFTPWIYVFGAFIIKTVFTSETGKQPGKCI